MLLRRAQIALAVLAVVIAAAVGLAAGVTVASTPVTQVGAVPAGTPVLTGVIVGVGTLVICWTMLVVAGAVWRSRLAARDSRDWAGNWARVEPLWRRNTD